MLQIGHSLLDWVRHFNAEGYRYDASESDDNRITFDRKGIHPGTMLLELNAVFF